MTDATQPLRRPSSSVGAPDGTGPRVVIAAVDGSPRAAHAAYYAAGLARRTDARLILVHVQRPSVVWADLGASAVDCVVATTEPPPEVLALAYALGRDIGIEIELIVRFGSPVSEIARVADDRNADVVVAGVSGPLLRHLARSIPIRLARRNAWPVMTVP